MSQVKEMLQQLADSLEPEPAKCHQWIQLAFRQLSKGNGSNVLNSLWQEDRSKFMVSVSLQAGHKVITQM